MHLPVRRPLRPADEGRAAPPQHPQAEPGRRAGLGLGGEGEEGPRLLTRVLLLAHLRHHGQ